MAATIEINERNGAPAGTLTHGITNSNMGNTDEVNTDPVAKPVVPGENTMEKWQQLAVTDMGGSSSIKNIRVYRNGALGGSAVHLANLKTSAYAGAPTYASPTASDSSIAVNAMPTSLPASANLGIGGSLTGELTTTGNTDYLVHQIQVDASDVAGSTSTLTFVYDEIA